MARYSVVLCVLVGGLTACNLAVSPTAGTLTPAPTRTLPGENTTPLPRITLTPAITTAPPDAADTLTAPPIEATAEPCLPPSTWTTYTIARGDTLARIATLTNSTVDELTAANCLENPNRIRVGQTIVVPRAPLPAFTPTPTT